ncbi:MAG: hypothetical protein A2805_01015 [Candidatus Andersenbacteria bacterium RIFCSPHIGHO2_01_FULL_46_36]|uniref:Uncharacterized protein n=1 Tax=Candidatus Andersenbacteria bacterium RIFCSPHIGHO2_12_FULL_45_11 TaxID=1797281 RepID=A0A1G1X0X0_9BACT|nr:MAG: hypothetical protein A2805_01015 [Candidatus Andersenbacteria bacterium RIFCSPHIGHO2_01_FULL_46_36]OGY33656.1 MAG: hypothetical protein A3D99_03875 [Candidatus Andersenbacteria bacterium RIFCSPHIGHO2_12_FULL_45_11]
MTVLLPKHQLRVLSAIAANFCVVWLAAAFIAEDHLTLFGNLTLGIIALVVALFFEKQLESYGH